MEEINKYIFLALSVSICSGIIMKLAPSTASLDKYVRFVTSITVLAVIAVPIIGLAREATNAMGALKDYNTGIEGEMDEGDILLIYENITSDAAEALLKEKLGVECQINVSLFLNGDDIEIEGITFSYVNGTLEEKEKIKSFLRESFKCSVEEVRKR